MDLEVRGPVWFWRGPSPYHFVTVPQEESDRLREVAAAVTYGWGMVPVRVRIGVTQWETSLYSKDGRYVVPLKDAVRTAEDLDVGDEIALHLSVRGLS